jgi:hypothetical protein
MNLSLSDRLVASLFFVACIAAEIGSCLARTMPFVAVLSCSVSSSLLRLFVVFDALSPQSSQELSPQLFPGPLLLETVIISVLEVAVIVPLLESSFSFLLS